MFDYEKSIGDLPKEQRLRFYELLSHNLTVCIRSVWSDDSLTDGKKLDQIKLINEILHRTTAKISVIRLNTHEWSESDTWTMIQGWASKNQEVMGHIGWAIRISFKTVSDRQENKNS